MSKQNQLTIAIMIVALVALIAVFAMRQDGMSGAETGDAAGSEAVPAIGPVGPISTPDEDLGALETPNPLGEIVLGNDDAPVTIVEYSSLTCPHCGAFHRDTLPALT